MNLGRKRTVQYGGWPIGGKRKKWGIECRPFPPPLAQFNFLAPLRARESDFLLFYKKSSSTLWGNKVSCFDLHVGCKQ